MNPKQASELYGAATNALSLLNRIQAVMLPIKLCNLPLHPHDVKALYELTRDAANPLRAALDGFNETVAPSWDRVEEARDNIAYPKTGRCVCRGSFHELDCVLRVG